MTKVEIAPFRPIYPTPAALITCVGPDGTPNIITLGEVYNLSLRTPPVVGIGIHKARYSYELIAATSEYVVNLPTGSILDKVDACGNVSGRDVDKFAAFGLTPTPEGCAPSADRRVPHQCGVQGHRDLRLWRPRYLCGRGGRRARGRYAPRRSRAYPGRST